MTKAQLWRELSKTIHTIDEINNMRDKLDKVKRTNPMQTIPFVFINTYENTVIIHKEHMKMSDKELCSYAHLILDFFEKEAE